MLIKLAYTAFIGILFATFVGVGISTFYERPIYPEQTDAISKPLYPDTSHPETSEMIEARKRYDQETKQFQKDNKYYSRNVSIITLVIAVTALAISLTFLKNLKIISDGLLFGAILTLIYSIGLGFDTDDNKFRFLVVTIGFAISLFLGYVKFVKPNKLD